LPSEATSNIQRIAFSSDGLLLKGTLHLPAKSHPPVVFGSHGLFSTSNSPKQIELAKKCNANGLAYFRFDHRGCGESEGVFEKDTSLDARCADLLNAVETVLTRNDTGKRIGLFGSSMGGAVCISLANAVKIEAMVTFAAPVRSRGINKTIENSDDSNNSYPLFDGKNLQFDLSDKLSNLHNILVFHGDEDRVVPPSNAREIYTKAGNPKKLIMQKGGDHPMNDVKHQEHFIRKAAFWFRNGLMT
jgi:alpha-beta hydrolase superfamily lysophospholipase